MPRPLSRSSLERLGRRLVTDPPEASDIEELHRLLAAYRPILGNTVEAISEHVEPVLSSRIKNTGTILEKLRRNGGHTLSTIQDLAGVRLVVVGGGRDRQDQIAAAIQTVFEDAERAPKLVDRRLHPVQGYRALHVIVYPDGYPIEVQVRTRGQHLWAEWFERTADQYGRGIRYGEPPVSGGDGAEATIESLLLLADQIAEAEESGNALPLPVVALAAAVAAIDRLGSRGPGP